MIATLTNQNQLKRCGDFILFFAEERAEVVTNAKKINQSGINGERIDIISGGGGGGGCDGGCGGGGGQLLQPKLE